jgi:hypothetical protein
MYKDEIIIEGMPDRDKDIYKNIDNFQPYELKSGLFIIELTFNTKSSKNM